MAGWMAAAGMVGGGGMGNTGLSNRILGPGLSVASARESANEADTNRAFQIQMRKTRYQDAVGDLRKAGLNPALAYMTSAGGAPPNPSVNIPDYGKSFTGGAAMDQAASMNRAQRSKLKKEGKAIDQGTKNAKELLDYEKAVMSSQAAANLGNSANAHINAQKGALQIPLMQADADFYQSDVGSSARMIERLGRSMNLPGFIYMSGKGRGARRGQRPMGPAPWQSSSGPEETKIYHGRGRGGRGSTP